MTCVAKDKEEVQIKFDDENSDTKGQYEPPRSVTLPNKAGLGEGAEYYSIHKIDVHPSPVFTLVFAYPCANYVI